MKKVPQKLFKTLKQYNVSVSSKSGYREILAGKREEFSTNNIIENNIIVHVGTSAQLHIKGCIDNLVLLLEKNAEVRWSSKEENDVKKIKNISAILRAGAKFNLISSVNDKVGSTTEMVLLLVGVGATVNIEKAIDSVKIAETKNNILINHLAGCTESNYFSRVIVNDGAKVFTKIKTIVSQKSVKSIAHQKIDNLILSEKAAASGQPQLEINNNDVICTHALTTGHLDENEIFYAKSRGINEKRALSMISEGFLRPIDIKLSDLNNETL